MNTQPKSHQIPPDSPEYVETDPKPRRRYLQLSRAFLVVLTLACVWFGLQVNRANQRRKAVAWVLEMGGQVLYDDQFDDEGNPIFDAKPTGSKWLRDFYHHVVYVGLSGTEASDLTPLANLTSLELLYVGNTQVSDLTPLAKLKSLKELLLPKTQVSDIKPLVNLTSLEWLDLSNTQVSDMAPLAKLKSLEYLDLRKTPVSEEQITKLRQAFPNCQIYH